MVLTLMLKEPAVLFPFQGFVVIETSTTYHRNLKCCVSPKSWIKSDDGYNSRSSFLVCSRLHGNGCFTTAGEEGIKPAICWPKSSFPIGYWRLAAIENTMMESSQMSLLCPENNTKMGLSGGERVQTPSRLLFRVGWGMQWKHDPRGKRTRLHTSTVTIAPSPPSLIFCPWTHFICGYDDTRRHIYVSSSRFCISVAKAFVRVA